MVYTLLSVLFTTLLLTFVTCYMILRVAVSVRPLRRMLLFFVFVTPFAALVALVRVIFGKSEPIRYNLELGRIEDEIERERIRTFGGSPMHPSFSHRWQKSYIYALEKSASAAAKRFGHSIDPAFCVTPQR
jgi:ABC-type sugar transport system permease subunit